MEKKKRGENWGGVSLVHRRGTRSPWQRWGRGGRDLGRNMFDQNNMVKGQRPRASWQPWGEEGR